MPDQGQNKMGNDINTDSSTVYTQASSDKKKEQKKIDRFQIELKAWIPHSKVVDPEEKFGPRGFLSKLDTMYLNKLFLPRLDYSYSAHYRGDNHTQYAGTYRVLSTIEFDWDGQQISNFKHFGDYGTTYRDYKNKIALVYARPFGKNMIWHNEGTDEKKASRATNGNKLSNNSFNVGFSSQNPLAAPFAPHIDASMIGTIVVNNEKQILILDYLTDGFPSHGFSINKNGVLLSTNVVNDASAAPVLGPLGAAFIFKGLTSQDNKGSVSIQL